MIIVWAILAAAVAVAMIVILPDLVGPEAYHRAYRRAELRDLEYYRTHPGCTYTEAHRERDRVMKRFRRY